MQGILVNISDHPTLPLKRKQEVFCFKTHWVEETVEVFLRLHHYQNNNGEYGDEITSPSIANYESKLTASNVRKVDPTNGLECYSEIVQQATEPTEENPEGTPEIVVYKRITDNVEVVNPIGQFDFFNLVIRNQPVSVGQMLTNFVQIDDQVKNKWMKEKVLIDLALNYPPVEKPKLIKLAGKERGILSRYYSKKMYFNDSFIDFF